MLPVDTFFKVCNYGVPAGYQSSSYQGRRKYTGAITDEECEMYYSIPEDEYIRKEKVKYENENVQLG